MNKISDNVSEQLEVAAQEALQQIDPFQQLINAGIQYEQNKEKSKRKHKVKEQKIDMAVMKRPEDSHIIAIVDWDGDDGALSKQVNIPDDILIGDYDLNTISDYLSNTYEFTHYGFDLKYPYKPVDHDEFCQWEIEKAHFECKSEPDFDFRKFYEKGDKIYLVRYYDTLKTKEMIYMTLRTVYARGMVGVVEKSYCQCIGISDKDNLFINRRDALDYFNSIKAAVADEYNEETGKKKRKRKRSNIEVTEVEQEYDEEDDE